MESDYAAHVRFKRDNADGKFSNVVGQILPKEFDLHGKYKSEYGKMEYESKI